MRKLLLAGVFLVLTAGCQLFDKPGYYGTDGSYTPPERGVFTVLSEGATAAGGAGLPWAGAVGGLLGLIGGAGAFLTDKKRKKDMKGVVKLFNELKPKLSDISNDKQLEKFILKYAPEDSPFGKALKQAWKALKSV